MKQTIQGFDDDYVVRHLSEKISREGLTPDEAMRRQIWNITGPTLEGEIRVYDGPVPEDLVNEALKIIEQQNKAKKSMA
ncbi:MAG: hypothetical protein ACLPVJ_12860 [Syntrophobacteraceae bacterium]